MSEGSAGRWPTFLVIGAARTGTTTLHGILRSHPSLFLPPCKEPNYFALRAMGVDLDSMPPKSRAKWGPAVSDPEKYRALFTPETRSRPIAFGEISPVYLAVPGTAEQIASTIPDVRLVAILRDPIERARSHHAHYMSIGVETNHHFGSAFEADRAKGAHSEYHRQGLYAELLEPYLAGFSRDQILLLDNAELTSDFAGTISRVCAHIGVEDIPLPKVIPTALKTEPPEIDPDIRDRLIRDYQPDTTRLIEQLGYEPARAWATAP